MTEVEEQEEYEVRIGAFNGPMDLLVYLVQKKEVPLEQISIAEIADQFLKWVNEYEGTDLSKAGDFLYMASRLMALKVQELLPAEQRDPEMEAEYNEDREQLMKEMLEYQRFKQVASGLQEMEGENFGTYSRGRLEKTQTDEETLADANIWQLFRAYQKSLKTKISETVHHIELDYVTIQDRQQAINNYLSVNGRALFEDLLDNDSHPIVAAVTFMAMLEMIKTDEIVFRQSELFGPIWIYRKKNNADYAEEMAHETVFFSKDPDVKPGLVEAIRNQALARSKEQSVGDLAAVMREAVLWTSRGRNVTEDDLTAMLEGREDLSEVQENPFAEMMKEDDAAENAQAPAENAPAEPVADTAATTTETIAEATSVSEEAPVEEIVAPVTDVIPATEPEPPLYNTEDVASVEKEIPDQVGNDNSSVEEPVDEAPAEEPRPTDVSATEPAAEQTMTDEEFEAFMKKAQAFYDTQASENGIASSPTAPRNDETDDSSSSDDSDDDDFPSIEVHSGD